jgi:hypothetical protein
VENPPYWVFQAHTSFSKASRPISRQSCPVAANPAFQPPSGRRLPAWCGLQCGWMSEMRVAGLGKGDWERSSTWQQAAGTGQQGTSPTPLHRTPPCSTHLCQAARGWGAHACAGCES